MALDGIVIANVIMELKSVLLNGRINKIAQPEKDELILIIKTHKKETFKLLLSAGAGMPLIYLTKNTKPSPMTAPNFCMLLRKHLNNGRILDITQPEFERIVNIKLEHMDELGELQEKHLIIELMGKHSNIIFCDDNMKIIDSIKRVNKFMSSVREVLPGRDYFIPQTKHKDNPLIINYDTFNTTVLKKPLPIYKAIYTSLTGISPLIANEICCRASIDPGESTAAISEEAGIHLFRNFKLLIEGIKEAKFSPNVILEGVNPIEFSSIRLKCYAGHEVRECDSASSMLEEYYGAKNNSSKINQKSANLRKTVSNAIDRSSKKYDLQLKQFKDTEKRDKFRIYGELINTYGYDLLPGSKELKTVNYYNGEEIIIPLNPLLSPKDNAKKCFDKYNKLKRTYEALTTQIQDTKDELKHLTSIKTSLDMASEECDLVQLRKELVEYGYIKKNFYSKKGKPDKRKSNSKSLPLHYISSDGYHIYVGKNNYQNDELTFNFANGGDWWFHTKDIPGSHVIIKSNGDELPDKTFEEAARLAAYYSSAKGADKVEIDYTLKKNVKKPRKSRPGFVVYYTNYSLISDSDITDITKIDDE